MRARENFEKIRMTQGAESAEYSSFSHTFNLWYEKPYDEAFGLGFGPLVMLYANDDGQSSLGQRMRLSNFGVEYKKWHKGRYFYRLGGYLNYLRFENPNSDSLNGAGILIAYGYEVDFDGIGLAFEGGIKKHQFQDRWSAFTVIVAIGVHFYEML